MDSELTRTTQMTAHRTAAPSGRLLYRAALRQPSLGIPGANTASAGGIVSMYDVTEDCAFVAHHLTLCGSISAFERLLLPY